MESGPLDVRAFRTRQQLDLARFRLPFKQTSEDEVNDDLDDDKTQSGEDKYLGGDQPARNSDGDRLQDLGVDENLESYDEDDMPLAELLRRRRTVASDESTGKLD